MITIGHPILSTWIFIMVFLALNLFFAHYRPLRKELFPLSTTRELKGFAILAIIFSHIGFFLVSDHRFLWPLSIMAGVGVNLFLLLSGYGLSVSSLKRPTSLVSFYRRRLTKIYLPLWIVLSLLLILDYLILHRTYALDYLAKAFLGIFQGANLETDINGPLWYFTIIVFYYLAFPLVFMKKHLWLSALILFGIGDWIVHSRIDFLSNVMRLYEVHTIAFPLGMFLAWLQFGKNKRIIGATKSFHQAVVSMARRLATSSARSTVVGISWSARHRQQF